MQTLKNEIGKTLDVILSEINRIILLVANPPYLAPKGSLSGKINIKEGSIIEHDPALMPIKYNSAMGLPKDIDYSERLYSLVNAYSELFEIYYKLQRS